MSLLPSAGDVERFRRVVARRLGLAFDEAKLGLLAEVLGRRVEARGQRGDVYLQQLESVAPMGEELRALATELTVPETYFFRNPDQFRALTLGALPSRLAARTGSRRLNLLSAGCASGEEAYSLAISVRDVLPDPSWTLSIRAVDVNRAMLDRARRARYSAWSLRETPPDMRRRWFSVEGQEFALDGSIRAAVTFEERNLADNDPALWTPSSYDAVFCRNVIMYLTPDTARALIERISRALVSGGYLFLGHAETLRGLSHDFHLQHTHDTFYYRRRAAVGDEAREEPGPAVASPPAPALEPALVDDADSWVETIARAARRIQALSDGRGRARTPQPVGAATAGTRPTWDLGRSLELLKSERFADALEVVDTLPAAAGRDPDVLLLRAILLTHRGQLGPAAAVCAELLGLDELHSGAHYLLALCREGAGDGAGAVEHDRIAVYLDPGFAMPRLHLGLMARRGGDHRGARLEFEQALPLLQRENESRVLLFGGGFGRQALVDLCRAELIACGGRP
jgi:chemotaxis protein methyltransferase CheR